ncbi:MAG TPA: hypothetical protein VJH03_11375 [Blastocatellia bacterium]|nr:hypothetical protein [Blastocatellia bacterium]
MKTKNQTPHLLRPAFTTFIRLVGAIVTAAMSDGAAGLRRHLRGYGL